MLLQNYRFRFADWLRTQHLLGVAVTFSVVLLFGCEKRSTDRPVESVTGNPKMERALSSLELWEDFQHHRQSGSADQATETLRAILSDNPNDVAARYLLAFDYAYSQASQIDSVRERYQMVKKGIELLIEGCQANPQNRELSYLVARLLGSRIGRTDERRQFRDLFADDTRFHNRLSLLVDVDHALGPNGKPDNWLVAGLWFNLCRSLPKPQQVVVSKKVVQGITLRIDQLVLPTIWTRDELDHWTIHPLLVELGHANCLREFALVVEEDGHFGETAINAWAAVERSYEALSKLQTSEEDVKLLVMSHMVSYWQQRSQIEQTQTILDGRRLLFQAREKQEQNYLHESAQLYGEGFDAWARAFEQNASLVEDNWIRYDLTESIERYVAVRQSLDLAPLPEDFSLQTVRDQWSRQKDTPDDSPSLESVRPTHDTLE